MLLRDDFCIQTSLKCLGINSYLLFTATAILQLMMLWDIELLYQRQQLLHKHLLNLNLEKCS